MSIMVKLAIENRPGVLTRIITALRNLEQVLETNTFGDHPDPAMATQALSFKGHGLSNQQIQTAVGQWCYRAHHHSGPPG